MKKTIEYLFYLFVFLLPWQTRWIWHQGKLNEGLWEYGTYSLYGTEIFFGIILVLFLFWRVAVCKRGNGIAGFSLRQKTHTKVCYSTKREILKFVISSLLVISFLSIFWAQNKGLAFYASIKLFEGTLLFWIVSTIKFRFTKLGIVFVSSALIQAGLGIWQFLNQFSFANKWLGMALLSPAQGGISVVEGTAGRWLRAYGSLPHPNILAGWLVIGLFVLLGLAFRFAVQKKSFWKALHPNFRLSIFIYWSCVVIVTGLFFTFSREAWLALAIGLLFFWIIVLIKKQAGIFYKLLATGLATIIVLSIIFWPLLSTRLSGQDRLEVKSQFERATYLEQSFQLIKKHPILGMGIGNYTLAVHNEINPDLKSWDYQPVHNLYLLILAELGMVGLAIFVWLIIKVVRKLKITSQAVWPLVYSSVVFVVLIIGFFDHYLWTLHFGIMIFWLILGLAFKDSKSG